ncbi:PIN domain-containing protein [Streptomyces sp. NPDC001093]|uniref:PIN domain-containing protein n=1 Tax=Streptomyces sp. NPDC001093 TaxID=3154376 RepID=UPI003317F48F
MADVIPTSEMALHEAAFREANGLAPCKDDGKKTGARDAAIWLSAVEYAKTHPDETVYFVSDNTRDFGNGTSYAEPMRADVVDLAERFVHLTGLGEVIDRFTKPTTVDQDIIQHALKAEPALGAVIRLAHTMGGGNQPEVWLSTFGTSGFPCTPSGPDSEALPVRAFGWVGPTLNAHAMAISNVDSYRVGEHVWCMATVRWLIAGLAISEPTIRTVACTLETRILFAAHSDDPRLTVLRHSTFDRLTDAKFAQVHDQLTWNLVVDPASAQDELVARIVRSDALARTMADPDTKPWMKILAATAMMTSGNSSASRLPDVRLGETDEG